jgi:hypothetical protein
LKFFLRSFTKLNGWLIRMYPREFQGTFGQELREVHTAALDEMRARGWVELVRFCVREMTGWVRTMLELHLRGLAHRLQTFLGGWPPVFPAGQGVNSDWRDDMLAWMKASSSFEGDIPDGRLSGLPALLFGLGVALNALISGPWYAIPPWRLYLGVAAGLLPMLVIGIGALVALSRRIPDWGWTWVGVAFMGVVVFIKTLIEEMADEGRPLMNAGGEVLLTLSILLVGVLLILAAAWRGWQRAGLLSLGFSAAFGLSLLMAFTAGPFFRHGLALLSAPTGLLMAAFVYAFFRGPILARMGVILGAAVVNSGIVLMGSLVWRDWLVQTGGPSPTVPLLVLSSSMVVAGPLLGWLLRPLRRSFKGVS